MTHGRIVSSKMLTCSYGIRHKVHAFGSTSVGVVQNSVSYVKPVDL